MRAFLMEKKAWRRVANPDLVMPRDLIPLIALRPGDSRTTTTVLRTRTGSRPDERASNAAPPRATPDQQEEGEDGVSGDGQGQRSPTVAGGAVRTTIPLGDPPPHKASPGVHG